MHVSLSEQEQEHIYSALGVAATEWNKVKKSLAKLNHEDQKVEDELALNAALRRQFNPRAEEEAREAERKRTDPSQLSIEDQPKSSGETGGGHRPGEVVKLKLVGEEEVPPTDEALRDSLMLSDRFVLLADIRGWTSSDREAALRWVNAMALHELSPDDAATPLPEEPECLELVALSEERVNELNRAGPYTLKSLPEGADDSTSVLVLVKSVIEDEPDTIEGEYVDGVEAEIRCARLNRDFIKNADIDPALAERWLAAGPWSVSAEPTEGQDTERVDRWYVVNESEGDRELASSQNDAMLTAARYNRTIAGKTDEGWQDPPAPKLDSDDLQEIKTAVEAGD